MPINRVALEAVELLPSFVNADGEGERDQTRAGENF